MCDRKYTCLGQFVVYLLVAASLSVSFVTLSRLVPLRTVRGREMELQHQPASTEPEEDSAYDGNSTTAQLSTVKAMSDATKEAEKRLNTLKENCAKYFPRVTGSHSQIIPSPTMFAVREKLFYCAVPKIACTSLKTAFVIWNGGPTDIGLRVHDRGAEKFLSKYAKLSPAEQQQTMARGFKFMFVRHPFERLVSAYINKFIETRPNERQFKSLNRKIQKLYRQNTIDNLTATLKSTSTATFAEFVRYLLDRKVSWPLDRHWRPYSEMCQPCNIQYDYIGRFETLQDDAEFILNKLGIKQQVQFQKLNSARRQNNTADVVDRYFSQLRPSDVEKLKEIYRLDFALFGYR